jgi:hypothetical protein
MRDCLCGPMRRVLQPVRQIRLFSHYGEESDERLFSVNSAHCSFASSNPSVGYKILLQSDVVTQIVLAIYFHRMEPGLSFGTLRTEMNNHLSIFGTSLSLSHLAGMAKLRPGDTLSSRHVSSCDVTRAVGL